MYQTRCIYSVNISVKPYGNTPEKHYFRKG
jgi:hypothetical protein